MRCVLILMAILTLGTGCDSLRGPHQSYLVPAVEGQVVDGETGDPLKSARVKKLVGQQTAQSDPFETKGATRLMTPPEVKTDTEGYFKFKPEKSGYLLFEQPGAYSFRLVVRHKGYQTLTTNIDLLKNKPIKTEKAPVVKVGRLPLQPKPKR